MSYAIQRSNASRYAHAGPSAAGAPASTELMRRLLQLPAGQRLIYHRGRSIETCPLAVRSAAQIAYEAGQVLLCQRRPEPGMTEWLAVGRAAP